MDFAVARKEIVSSRIAPMAHAVWPGRSRQGDMPCSLGSIASRITNIGRTVGTPSIRPLACRPHELPLPSAQLVAERGELAETNSSREVLF